MTDTATLVERVREALDEVCPHEYAIDCDLPEHATAIAGQRALTELAERLEAAESSTMMQENYDAACLRADEAEARVAELEEALRWLAKDETWATPWPDGAFGLPPNTWGPAPDWVRTFSLAALAKGEGQ